jgi:hypothetical protein
MVRNAVIESRIRHLVREIFMLEDEAAVDPEAHNKKVFSDLKKNASSISGLPDRLRSFISNKMQDVLKTDGAAYESILGWLDDHGDEWKGPAASEDVDGLVKKMKPIAQRREKKVTELMEQDPDFKRKEQVKKEIKWDEPLQSLMVHLDRFIMSRITSPKMLTKDISPSSLLPMVALILIAVAQLKTGDTPEE